MARASARLAKTSSFRALGLRQHTHQVGVCSAGLLGRFNGACPSRWYPNPEGEARRDPRSDCGLSGPDRAGAARPHASQRRDPIVHRQRARYRVSHGFFRKGEVAAICVRYLRAGAERDAALLQVLDHRAGDRLAPVRAHSTGRGRPNRGAVVRLAHAPQVEQRRNLTHVLAAGSMPSWSATASTTAAGGASSRRKGRPRSCTSASCTAKPSRLCERRCRRMSARSSGARAQRRRASSRSAGGSKSRARACGARSWADGAGMEDPRRRKRPANLSGIPGRIIHSGRSLWTGFDAGLSCARDRPAIEQLGDRMGAILGYARVV